MHLTGQCDPSRCSWLRPGRESACTPGSFAGTLHLVSSFPNEQNGWSCYYENTGTGTPSVRVYAMCLKINATSLPR